MKKLLLILNAVITVFGFAQNGLHYQWHKDGAGVFSQHNKDSIYLPLTVANNSTLNAIAIINPNTEQWGYITNNTPFPFSTGPTFSTKVHMKDKNNGLIVVSNSVHVTSNAFQTSAVIVNTVNIIGATSFGYYGNSGTNYLFSSNGISWASAFTSTAGVTHFSETKNKLYTTFNNRLHVSLNGGATYALVNSTEVLNGKVLTPNDDTLFVLTPQLMRSFDGGITWNSGTLPGGVVSQIVAKTGKELMIYDVASTQKTIYYSNNSGTSWVTYTNVPAYNNEELIATSQKFVLFPSYTSVDGSSWQDMLQMSPAPKPYDISFTGNVGLASYAQGYFGYSTNRGYNFKFLPNKVNGSSNDMMATKAIDANTFLVADRKGQIYLSNNQGNTWLQKTTSTTNNIPRKFSISNNKNIIVLSCLGSAYMSGDGGATFSWLNTTVSAGHYQTIQPVAGNIIDAAPSYPAPSFTFTGWELFSINASNVRTPIGTVTATQAEDVIDLHLVDDNTGYLASRNTATNATQIYKTTNAFVSATLIASIPTPTTGVIAYDGRYGNIQTFGSDTIIISGSGSPTNNKTNFYHISTNGGVTWNLVHTTFNKPINTLGDRTYKMAFFNPNEYMALISGNQCGSIAASTAVFLGTSTEQGTNVGINELQKNTEANDFVLYPNPAFGILNIECEILNEPANLIITNNLGQTVQETSFTTPTTVINIQHLLHGIYFVTLNQKGKTSTVKFIKE